MTRGWRGMTEAVFLSGVHCWILWHIMWGNINTSRGSFHQTWSHLLLSRVLFGVARVEVVDLLTRQRAGQQAFAKLCWLLHTAAARWRWQQTSVATASVAVTIVEHTAWKLKKIILLVLYWSYLRMLKLRKSILILIKKWPTLTKQGCMTYDDCTKSEYF